jgi:hypothetical protein
MIAAEAVRQGVAILLQPSQLAVHITPLLVGLNDAFSSDLDTVYRRRGRLCHGRAVLSLASAEGLLARVFSRVFHSS